MTQMTTNPSSRPAFTIPSILAIVCGIAAFTTSAGTSLFAAIGAIIFGIIGVLLSLAPSKRGGIISVLSILMGALGFIVGLIRLISR